MMKQALDWIGIMPRCRLCHEACQAYWALCDNCHADLPTLKACCPVCALPLMHPNAPCGDCLKTPKPYHASYCAFAYQNPINQLLLDFKQNKAWAVGQYLCTQWVTRHHSQIRAYSQQPNTLIVPVPSAQRATLKRGYNPSTFIAQYFAQATGLTVKALLRCHAHTAQKQLNRAARLHNLRGMYFMDNTQRNACKNQHVVLVDDVITSGATAMTASDVLLHHGALSVTVWALARTPKP